MQVEVLQLAQASQHPLRQVPQLVKTHLEHLEGETETSGITVISEEPARAGRAGNGTNTRQFCTIYVSHVRGEGEGGTKPRRRAEFAKILFTCCLLAQLQQPG